MAPIFARHRWQLLARAVGALGLLALIGWIEQGAFRSEAPRSVVQNGLRPGQQGSGRSLDPTELMLWKYVASCALRPDQSLADPKNPRTVRFAGQLGLAPEWLQGTCDDACRQKVSACLLALTNRTGKHVRLSLLSASPHMDPALRPGETDRTFPHQEGVFFGDVFKHSGYVCHGRDARKAPQAQRFCAVEPTSCSGLFSFADAGSCSDVCTMRCARLADGSERCAAAECRDPYGRSWNYPLTTYLRNSVEAGNAEAIEGATPDSAQALVILHDGDRATYRNMDFGPTASPRRMFSASFTTGSPGLRLEIALLSGRQLGALTLPSTHGKPRTADVVLAADDLSDRQDLLVRFRAPESRTTSPLGKIDTIEIR